jgi:hypothetical protein
MFDVNVLNDFEWHCDKKGYCLAMRNSRKMPVNMQGLADDEIVIVRNGEHSDSIKYRPFAGGGDLCATFASVKSPEELLRFVNNYGPLIAPSPPPPINARSIDLMKCFSEESVHFDLNYAEKFRELLRLKAEGNSRKLASYFESQIDPNFDFFAEIPIRLVGDSKLGVKLKVCPTDLLGALWYQLALKLSNSTLRVCPLCHSVFEAGAGTRLRADAKFCCHKHKVEFFNHNRPRLTRRSQQERKIAR